MYHEYQGPSSLLWSGLAPTSLGFWSCPVGLLPVISCLTAVTSDVLRTCEAEGTRGLSVWGVGESFILFASGGSSRICGIVTTAVQVGGWRRQYTRIVTCPSSIYRWWGYTYLLYFSGVDCWGYGSWEHCIHWRFFHLLYTIIMDSIITDTHTHTVVMVTLDALAVTPFCAGLTDTTSLIFLDRRYDFRKVRILLRTQEANSGNLVLASAIISVISSRG